MKTILITGGTGSWGNELTKQLLERGVEEIRIYSRGELAQVSMKRKFNDPRLKFIIGDVRNIMSLKRAMEGCDTVFHLAALKHVPVCEENTDECVSVNILGTENVVYTAKRLGITNVVDVSTDKACNPLNLYGACKRVGEKLMLNAGFKVIRAGNVMGTNGSVIPFFIEKAKKGETLPITNPEMTRYLMLIEDAIRLVLEAAEEMPTNKINVLDMKSAKLFDLAEVIWYSYNPDTFFRYDIIGTRQGEKVHEQLMTAEEGEERYSSDVVMSKPELRELLERGGFI